MANLAGADNSVQQADQLASTFLRNCGDGGHSTMDRDALARTLGGAMIDYFNGYKVGDVSLGFLQNGGT